MTHLPGESARRPGAGDNDDGTDVSQLAGDALVEQWLVAHLADSPLLPRAVHDGVVRALGTRDVDFVDKRVVYEVAADLRAPVGEADESRLDQRRKGVLDVRADVLVHRTELGDRDVALDEEFVHQVEWSDARHVASTQHRSDFG